MTNLNEDVEIMQVQVLSRHEDSIRFMVSGISTAFANALRRAMMAEVPTMAIEDCMIVENSSIMFDEIISHRLGLIPLTTDLDSYVLPEECSCKAELGCNRCRVSLSLEAETGEESRYVFSSELRSENPEIRPVSDRIPIAKLAPGQRIRLEAYARLGKGAEHSKWQPVPACGYKYLPKLLIDLGKCTGCGECVKICPKQVLELEKGKAVAKKELECTLCGDCARTCPEKPNPPIKVGWDEETYIFYVESNGALTPERIVKEAANLLRNKVLLLEEQVNKL